MNHNNFQNIIIIFLVLMVYIYIYISFANDLKNSNDLDTKKIMSTTPLTQTQNDCDSLTSSTKFQNWKNNVLANRDLVDIYQTIHKDTNDLSQAPLYFPNTEYTPYKKNDYDYSNFI